MAAALDPGDPRQDRVQAMLSMSCPIEGEWGRCVCCGYRYGVSCTCGMTFAEKAATVGIDEEALRKLHGR